MSEEQASGFLSRWSRRKAASREAASVEAPAAAPEETVPELPSVESLGADSDYTVFLARGVARAVQAQALRVAWTSDPAIANFRGMAEYAWDFNAPGYGALASGDNTTVWLSQIIRSGANLIPAADAEASAPGEHRTDGMVTLVEPAPARETQPPPLEALSQSVVPVPGPGCSGNPAPGHQADQGPHVSPQPAAKVAMPVRRRHGGAVPV